MFKPVFVTLAAVSLTACMSAEAPMENASDVEFVRVTDAAAFSAAVADKRLESANNSDLWFTMVSDGSFDGEFGKGNVAGNWAFEGGYWCRSFTSGVSNLARDCQLAELKPGVVRLTRDRGRGDSGEYIIK